MLMFKYTALLAMSGLLINLGAQQPKHKPHYAHHTHKQDETDNEQGIGFTVEMYENMVVIKADDNTDVFHLGDTMIIKYKANY